VTDEILKVFTVAAPELGTLLFLGGWAR